MAGINKAILIGNLGKDPEVRKLDNGRSVANFSLATSETYKNRQGEKVTNTEWHNVVLWSPLAEIAERFLRKGNQVYIEGKIITRSYEDKEGNTRYVTEIEGRNMTLLGGRQDGDGGQQGYQAPQAQPTQAAPAQNNTSMVEDPTDDLPF